MRLEQYAALVVNTKPRCFMCPTDLRAKDIRQRPHADGWIVDGSKEKQWVYLECRKCKYQNSLDLFGIKRPTPERREPTTAGAVDRPPAGGISLDDVVDTVVAIGTAILDDSSDHAPDHFDHFGGGESGGGGASGGWDDSGGGGDSGGDGGGE